MFGLLSEIVVSVDISFMSECYKPFNTKCPKIKKTKTKT